MRLIQISIPVGKRERILRVLDDEDVDYVVTDETGGREYAGVAYFPLPTAAVEPVLGRLREAGLGEQGYTVVIDAETVISRRFEALQKRYAEETENADRIAREELEARAEDLVPSWKTYVVMTVISAVIAAAGLLLDSPATVVGAMVIAPFLGPAMATSVGTVLSERGTFVRGLKFQVAGLTLAVASAALFAVFVRWSILVPPGLDVLAIAEIRERLRPDFLSLVVALGAGVAGVISLTTGISSALVGVMIAAALIPPAAAVGVGLAWGIPSVALGAGVLVLVNVVSINLAALGVLWRSGYRPERLIRTGDARRDTIKRAAALLAVMALLSVFLGGTTYASYQTATAEESIENAVRATLSRPAYDDVSMLEIEFEYSQNFLFRQPSRVVVTLGVPPDAEYPRLSERLEENVEAGAGRNVTLQIRYVQVERVE